MTCVEISARDEQATIRLAELVALKLAYGDCVLLSGDLGAGKTTFARALIRARLDDPAAEIPSPTFALRQDYDAPRATIRHFDLYRVGDLSELNELGLDEGMTDAITIVEWPERADAAAWSASTLRVALTAGETSDARSVTLTGIGRIAADVPRLAELWSFLAAAPEWHAHRVAFLQGDASSRSYARLVGAPADAILMDSPSRPDGPVLRGGKSYSQIAHLAETVHAFVAVDTALRAAGIAAPALHHVDLDRGFILMEDLGRSTFGMDLTAGTQQEPMWRAAVDVLVALRTRLPRTRSLPVPADGVHHLARFDRAALEIEIGLLLDWFWPAATGAPAAPALIESFSAVWSPLLDTLLALPEGWFLRDYHSPNLIWRPDRQGLDRVGVIDFQDALAEHWAFDLVSLLQDARVDVPEAMETALKAHYVAAIRQHDAGFDETGFEIAYAVFGAQRATRLIGLFVRLARRDGKRGYLAHLPRAWRHLERNLRHPALAGLESWMAANFPQEIRGIPPDA
jgi:hypothetical protein